MNQTTILYYREGKSDKVYVLNLTAQPEGSIVTFAYGRRGSTLTPGVKTPQSVHPADALAIYESVRREKQGKGYVEDPSGTPVIPLVEPRAAVPMTRVAPQLLNPADLPIPTLLTSREWWMQEKHDGERRMVCVDSSGVSGFNKRGVVCALPQAVADAAARIGQFCLIDGEQVGDTLHAFDLLECGFDDLRGMPYAERYHRLSLICTGLKRVGISVTPTAKTPKEKRECFAHSKAENHEGVVFKLADEPYIPGRPNSGGPQLKFKFVESASVVVTGHNAKRSVTMGAWDNEQYPAAFVAVGNVTIPPNQAVPEAGTVIEVRYLYAYRGGSLYQPVYLGERTDMTSFDCTINQLKFKA